MTYACATPASLARAVKLCTLLLVAPRQFLKCQEDDNEQLEIINAAKEKEPGLYVVRRAFFISLLLVMASGSIGCLLGISLSYFDICATTRAITWLQISGAGILLWGTLFVRGWDIQTYGGITLVERVNQWLYRMLYCIGTAAIIFSLSWPLCS